MDDTAFFYSRTLRMIVALAIIIPLAGIGALVWHFTSDVPEDTIQDEAQAYEPEYEAKEDPEEEAEESSDDNPLKPIGPPASSRIVSGS